MIGVRYVFYSYSTESGKWKNVTFTPTDSRTGRAIEVNKKTKKTICLIAACSCLIGCLSGFDF